MNVFYRVGFAAGLLVLAADIAKGAAAVALARYIAVPALGDPLPMYVQLIAGVTVVAGHAFPVFLKFHGGRGGAACIGVLAFVMPWGIPFYIAIFGIVMGITRYPTLSYSAAFLCYPFIGWLKYHSAGFIIFSIVLLLLPLIKYIPRIKEMRAKGGSWSRVLKRKDVKDRL
jgi:glycerol-3-phosphate acyltransferase PlsY